MSRYTTTGNSRPPMSEARRRHIHGPLVTLAQQAKEAGEPGLIRGTLIAGLCLGVIVGLLYFTAGA